MSPTKLNVAANYLNFIVQAVLGFVINPLLVNYLGAQGFGLWKICLRILDLATAADGQATQGLKWALAFRASDSEVKRKQREVGASLAIWLMWLPVLITVLLGIIYALPLAINGFDHSDLATVRWIGAILGANVILAALLGVPNAVLVGTNQGYRATAITSALLILSNVLMLVAAWFRYGLPMLAIIVLTTAILNGFLSWLVARRKVSWWGIARPSWADIKQLAGFSNWTMVWTFVQMLFLSTEFLLFSFVGGAVAVTNYTFTSYGIQFALSICLLTASAIMPQLGALVGGGRSQEARILISQTREIVLVIVAVTGSAILLFNREFVSLWSGADRYLGDPINALMVAAFMQLALIRCDAQMQDVSLKIRGKVLIGFLGCLLSMLLGWLGYLMAGNLVDIYWGILAGRLIVSFIFSRLIDKMVAGARYSIRGVTVTVMLLGSSYAVSPHLDPESWIELVVDASAAVFILCTLAYIAILSEPTRQKIMQARLPRIT